MAYEINREPSGSAKSHVKSVSRRNDLLCHMVLIEQ